MQDSHRQLITVLIALFTLLQLAVLFVFGYTPYPDRNGYITLAEECLNHGEPYPVTSLLNDYPFLWNIGAINLTAASLALFHSVKPLLILYSLMKGVTAWLFYTVTKHIYGSCTALIAITLYVLYPANYGEGTSLLSELPFMFLVMTALYLTIVRKWIFMAGIFLALANWIRPMAIIFLMALLIYLMFKWQKSLKLIIGYIMMTCIIGFTSQQRTGLFLYQAKTGWMALTDFSTGNGADSQKVRDCSSWNVAQKDSVWKSMFFIWLKKHPMEYVSQMPGKFVDTYASDNVNMCTFIPDKANTEYMYETVSMKTIIHCLPRLAAVQWLTLLNLIFYYLLLLSALASLLYFDKNTHLLPLAVIILGTMILLIAGHGEARFHTPFMPFFIMLSATFFKKILWKG